MLMLEHDAKDLIAAHGVAVPDGVLVRDGARFEAPPFGPPWFIKAQVPAGGRGKAGGVVRADSIAQCVDAVSRMMGVPIKGHRVRECRIEQAIGAALEAYLSLSVDPVTGRIQVLVSPEGGVDVEDSARRAALLSGACGRDIDAIRHQFRTLAGSLPEPARRAFSDAGERLAAIFFTVEATLLEINPLLIREDGSWVAGDAKMIVDENALVRQPALSALVERRADAYPEVALKLARGFDYVELDRCGDIGLVTTGAGLSMQLIDELLEQGCRPFNFCDIRSGNFRGDPARLIQVLRWIAGGPNVRSVLVNFFAGITHLGELSRLLLAALEAVPELKAPVTVRLVGNGLEEAREVFRSSGSGIVVEPDLEKAVAEATAVARRRT